ncbi:MAG: hypothetical protein IPM07_23210 [Anaerolineales bacterium]|nr:hypothetical protein [Anaerolineales bacterium]
MLEAKIAPKSPVPPKVLAHFEPEYLLGTTESDENSVAMTIVPDTVSSSMIAMLEYTTPSDKAEFTIELDGADMSEFDALTFYARADSESVEGQKLGFEVSAYNTDLLTSDVPVDESALTSKVLLEGTEWRKYELPVQEFVGEASHEKFWASLDHLLFVFSPDLSGESGAVYLDNVQFERVSGRSPGRTEITEARPGKATPPPEEPTLTATVVPEKESPTSTVVPTATETPTPITEEPPVQLLVSNFDSCRTKDSGAAYERPRCWYRTALSARSLVR